MKHLSGSGIMLKPVVRVRKGLLEVIVVMFYAALMAYYPIIQQYLYTRLLKDKRQEEATFGQLQHRLQENHTSLNVCYNGSSGVAEAEAQADSANWLFFITLANAVPGSVSTLVIGAITDVRGRRLGMVIPAVGAIIKLVMTMLVIKLNRPIFLLIIGGLIDGCMGSLGTAFTAAFAYLADITKPGKTRTLRITIMEALMGLVVSCASLGVGYFIKAAGYFYPLLVALVLLLICMALILFCLPETVESRSDIPVLGCNRLTSTLKTYFKRRERCKRSQLLLLLTAFLLFESVIIDKGLLDTLYQMGFPFCWQSVRLGIYTAIGTIIQVSSMLILVRPLTKCISENVVCMIGLLSTIGELVMTGLADSTTMLFIAPVAGFLLLMPVAMIKAVSSHLVGREEQGSLFAGISSIQMLCFTFGSSVFNPLYASTVATFPGLVFLIMAGVVFISFALIGWAELLRRKFDNNILYTPIPSAADGDYFK